MDGYLIGRNWVMGGGGGGNLLVGEREKLVKRENNKMLTKR